MAHNNCNYLVAAVKEVPSLSQRLNLRTKA